LQRGPQAVANRTIIIEGNPEARSHKLSASTDGAAATLIWAYTEGKFNWYYDFDETIIILEGSVVLESEGMPPKHYSVGDEIFSAAIRTLNGTLRLYEERRFLPPDQSDRVRFRYPRRQPPECS
jgi:uncharacterized cupin superfamily protein